jgi:hypothetical protein
MVLRSTCLRISDCLIDETLPNFIKRKYSRKGEKKKQEARTKVQASKQPKRGGPCGDKGTTKYPNLHQLLEAYPLEKGGGKPDKTPSLEEPSPAITVCLEMEVTCTLCKGTDTPPFLKNTTLLKEGLRYLLLSMPC